MLGLLIIEFFGYRGSTVITSMAIEEANDQLWVAEAKRRRDEVRSGSVEAIPGEEALQKVRDVVRR